MSERASECAQRSARAKRAVRSKRMSERCERTSERTSEWPSTLRVHFIVILPTVERCERTSERTSEWPSTNVPISRDSESLWKGGFRRERSINLQLDKFHYGSSASPWREKEPSAIFKLLVAMGMVVEVELLVRWKVVMP